MKSLSHLVWTVQYLLSMALFLASMARHLKSGFQRAIIAFIYG
jgi:hypothetical protein